MLSPVKVLKKTGRMSGKKHIFRTVEIFIFISIWATFFSSAIYVTNDTLHNNVEQSLIMISITVEEFPSGQGHSYYAPSDREELLL